MRKFGLIGFPLSHSFSEGYFNKKFKEEALADCEYQNFPLESIELLPELIRKEPELVGLNITIPYKQQVFQYLDDIEDTAKVIGAVNTIKIIKTKTGTKLKGYNTDIYGFEAPLVDALKDHHNSALILGTGGASKAVAYILAKHNINFTFVSRTPRDKTILSYTDLTSDTIKENTLIVNCSPIGMHPSIKECPNLPYCSISEQHILYDLIYNPKETRFLKKGKKRKATLINGLPMLYVQAEKSWEIWNL